MRGAQGSAGRVGERVARARRWSGVSQRRLSGLVGLSPTYLGAVERGGFMPGTGPLFALADVLGVSAAWLARGEGEEPTPDVVRAAVAAAEAKAKKSGRAKRHRAAA
ncbi:MAG TPA: helix-turn-helix transcriptional regulator [Polyangiaceae bacterium]|nr:helix-turn-helix transcriptional regulator [Polyangiaceae bacterium]